MMKTQTNQQAPDLTDKVVIGDKSTPTAPGQKVKVRLNSEVVEVNYDGKSTLLETFINAGLNAPYSCMEGNCMACLGKIVGGKAYMEDLCILSEDNVDAGEALTCQSRPASTVVEVDYDTI